VGPPGLGPDVTVTGTYINNLITFQLPDQDCNPGTDNTVTVTSKCTATVTSNIAASGQCVAICPGGDYTCTFTIAVYSFPLCSDYITAARDCGLSIGQGTFIKTLGLKVAASVAVYETALQPFLDPQHVASIKDWISMATSVLVLVTIDRKEVGIRTNPQTVAGIELLAALGTAVDCGASFLTCTLLKSATFTISPQFFVDVDNTAAYLDLIFLFTNKSQWRPKLTDTLSLYDYGLWWQKFDSLLNSQMLLPSTATSTLSVQTPLLGRISNDDIDTFVRRWNTSFNVINGNQVAPVSGDYFATIDLMNSVLKIKATAGNLSFTEVIQALNSSVSELNATELNATELNATELKATELNAPRAPMKSNGTNLKPSWLHYAFVFVLAASAGNLLLSLIE
jgi:hypothetical protein